MDSMVDWPKDDTRTKAKSGSINEHFMAVVAGIYKIQNMSISGCHCDDGTQATARSLSLPFGGKIFENQ
jgi:hypothetical protein